MSLPSSISSFLILMTWPSMASTTPTAAVPLLLVQFHFPIPVPALPALIQSHISLHSFLCYTCIFAKYQVLTLSQRPEVVTLLPHGVSPRSPFLYCTNLFFGLFSFMLYPNGFRFSVIPLLPSWNTFTEQPLAQSLVVSRPPQSLFLSLMHSYLLHGSP